MVDDIIRSIIIRLVVNEWICVVWCEKRFFYYRGKRGFKIFYLEWKKINIFIDIVIEIII